jgi:hypothetical protein
MNAQTQEHAIGVNQCWGFTPALNVFDPVSTRGGVTLLVPDDTASTAAAAVAVKDMKATPVCARQLAASAAAAPAATGSDAGDKDKDTDADADKDKGKDKDKDADKDEDEEDAGASRSVNVLLAGCADARHVLKTVAESRRFLSPSHVVHFYVTEQTLEAAARHMLLLGLLLERGRSYADEDDAAAAVPRLSLEARAQLFLEIFGNAMVREKTDAYIRSRAGRIINFIAGDDDDDDGGGGSRRRRRKKKAAPVDTDVRSRLRHWFDLSHLKFKERDELAAIAEYWRKGEMSMCELREHRLRGYYGERFDSRRWRECSGDVYLCSLLCTLRTQISPHQYATLTLHTTGNNLVDWDYNMHVKPVASIVHFVCARQSHNQLSLHIHM